MGKYCNLQKIIV